jgi:predicted MFS family arabinose efflux permease
LLQVLKRNPAFRRLWLAQVVTQAGDWLNRMAVLALIAHLGGADAVQTAGALFAGELALRLLPSALLLPLAGSMADRVSRKGTMIVADLLRALVVMGLLLIKRPEDLPLLYGLLFLQMALGPFYDAAHSATVPNLVRREDLHAAYGLTAVTWSTMLTLGALVGGLLLELTGVSTVFIIDAGTYLVSAALLVSLRLPGPPSQPGRFQLGRVLMLGELREAWQHLREKRVSSGITAKWHWSVAGGYLVCLSLLGKELSDGSSMAAAGLSISLLYAARGLGTGVGPIIARALTGSTDRGLRVSTAAGFLVAGLGYSLVAMADGPYWIFFLVALAHTGGSTIWVGSTTLWQRSIDDRWRGRVQSSESLGLTLCFSAMGGLVGLAYDAGVSLSWILAVLSLLTVLSGIGWFVRAEREAGQSQDASPI